MFMLRFHVADCLCIAASNIRAQFEVSSNSRHAQAATITYVMLNADADRAVGMCQTGEWIVKNTVIVALQ